MNMMDMEIWLESLGITAETIAKDSNTAAAPAMRMRSVQKVKAVEENVNADKYAFLATDALCEPAVRGNVRV